MKFHIQSAKITSPVSQTNWGGCFVEDNLVILLEIESDASLQASHLGKSVFENILSQVRQFTVTDKNSIKSLLSKLSENNNIKTAIIGLISDSQIFLGCKGDGIAVLTRDGEYGKVVSGGFISSGQIEDSDRIIFHSDRLTKKLGNKNLEKLYRVDALDTFEEEAALLISGDDNNPGSAVLLVKFQEKESAPEKNPLKFNLSLKNLLKNLKSKIVAFVFRITFKQKIIFSVLGFLLLILIFNITAGFIRANNSQKIKLINDSLSLVNSQYEEGKSLIDLNPVRSRELLSSAKLTLTGLLSKTKKNSREYKTLKDLYDKVSGSETSAYKIYKLTAVPVFFDISLIKSGGKGDIISSYNEKKVILDSTNRTVYFLDTKSKQSSIIAGSENVKNAAQVAIHGNFAYVLNDEGIYSVDIEKKETKKVISKDESWGEIRNLIAFAGNLYLLDVKNNAIWKYIATDDGFSQRIRYIGSGVPADFSAAQNLAIDGSVYVTGGNRIVKYTSGTLSQFSFKGLDDNISGIDSVSTSDTEKNIYILDKSTERIVVFDKDGLYHAQYQWDELKKASAIVASEAEGKIYILAAEKIYAIEIK